MTVRLPVGLRDWVTLVVRDTLPVGLRDCEVVTVPVGLRD